MVINILKKVNKTNFLLSSETTIGRCNGTYVTPRTNLLLNFNLSSNNFNPTRLYGSLFKSDNLIVIILAVMSFIRLY